METKHYQIKITPDLANKRADSLLSELLPLTRSRIRNLIDQGRVTCRALPVKASYKARPGDVLNVDVPPAQPIRAVAQDLPLDIVYQDAYIAVVFKPRGMVVHPAAGNPDQTLVNALLYALDGLSGIGGALRPGIVHRLDKDTSGLMLVAKDDSTHLKLSQAIAKREVQKQYLAVADGRFSQTEDTVRAPIGRHTSDRKKMAVADGGRDSATLYRVLEQYARHALIECTLITGRTHQIRVHMKHIGHPLVGDRVYGRAESFPLFPAQALHAYKITFSHPHSGEMMRFEQPPPADFSALLEKLRRV